MVKMKEWKLWRFEGGDRWNDWQPFSAKTIKGIVDQAGAYVLGLPAKRTPLGRLLGRDVHGILDVGEATHLRKRLDTLHKCASAKGATGHMAGWRLGSMALLGELGVKVDSLRISVCYSTSKEEAYRVEGAILRNYFRLFGELPPLNYKFNWSSWEET